MAAYKLLFRKSVARDLRSVPQKDLTRILAKIEGLAENPRPVGCEKLTEQARYRIRQGVYRIIYEISDSVVTVTVVKIAHRRLAHQ
ncbi:MAG TPA: type II toxin-antitoxin system RelE/ParE family toxin [Kineobactrum sp.]